VVGSGGADTVTGVQLQRLFGTMSTQMSFTTLGEQGERTKTVVKPPASQFKAASASGKRVTVQLSLQGTVFPATRGQTVIAQRWEGASWHSVARARLAAKGTYVIDVKAPGTYRTVYQGLDGPNVRVP
jgi:hypothetical protein